jgi:LPXTG-motif cell wall-anchored protein
MSAFNVYFDPYVAGDSLLAVNVETVENRLTVPIPASFALFGTTIVGGSFLLRRRRKRECRGTDEAT